MITITFANAIKSLQERKLYIAVAIVGRAITIWGKQYRKMKEAMNQSTKVIKKFKQRN